MADCDLALLSAFFVKLVRTAVLTSRGFTDDLFLALFCAAVSGMRGALADSALLRGAAYNLELVANVSTAEVAADTSRGSTLERDRARR